MSEVVCPCCGSHVEVETPLVDMNTNTVAFHGHSAHGSNQVIDLLYILGKNYPRSVSDSELIRGMHGLNEPDGARGVLRTVVCRARKLGDDVGFKIKNQHRRGYRMIVG